MNKNWYAVITADILYSKHLSSRQKLLCAAISNMSNEKGFCFATNKHFSDMFDCSVRTIQRDIDELINQEFINRVIKLNSKGEVELRVLTPMTPKSPPHDTHDTTPHDTSVTYNNKLINNKDNTLNYIPKSQKDFKAEDKIKDIEVIEPEEVEFDFDEHIRTTINNFPKKEKEKSCVKKEKGIFDYQGDIMLCFNDVCQYFERDLIPQDDKDVLSWLDTIDKLNRIDGLAFSDILLIVKSARSDKFWSKNFLSLTKLRRKDKDKIPYWKVFKEKFKFEKSKSESTFDAMQQVLNEIQNE